MKNTLKLLIVLLLALSFTACAGREIVPLPVADDYDAVTGATPSSKLRVGLVPGLYSDMFNQIIQPLLEEAGYDIEITYYENYAVPNIALAKGQIDLNMYQHYASLNNYKFDNNAALSAIAEIPTAPMGIYSPEYGSLKEIENGATVSIPNESAELSRALIVLESAGLLTLDPGINKNEATVDDIKSNPYDLKFSTARADKLILSFMICELTVIDSSYAEKDGIGMPSALYKEVMDEEYLVVIAVRTDSLYAQFVSDIIGIVYSDEYKAAIAREDGAFADCQRPRSFYK